RWAPLGPTPGSWPSSSMRSCTTPSYTSVPAVARARRVWRVGVARLALKADARQRRHAGQARQPGRSGGGAEAADATACERSHQVLLDVRQSAVGVPASGEDQVSERLRGLFLISWLDGLLGDDEVSKLALPVDRHFHEAAAGATLHPRLGQPL